ncbi:MAG: hypothetical protein L0Y72_29980 [Gemmataceae bacterium]|nr:hypothetical protein [Gemmataceae bacterium]MCI0743277.1 hypothetical protein [Gemmataceae bacterium]
MEETFDVVYLNVALDQFRDLFQRAKKKGAGANVLDVGKEIDKQLRLDPIHFGDPIYPLRHLGLMVYIRAMSPVVVTYGVHETEKVVFVGSFEAVPGLGI